MALKLPTLNDIQAAHEIIKGHVHHTPVLTCRSIDEIVCARLFFKCENFQKVGAFKFRGASHAVLRLPDNEAAKGVATHSSGNHAQALARAALDRGNKSYIVMPSNSPKIKIAAVKGYGAEITFCEPTLQARETTLDEVVRRTGAAFVHPYNNFNVICGQGTAALELLEQTDALDTVMAPVGGGGLFSGTLTAVKGTNPDIRCVGAEPVNADDAARSFKSGKLIPSENPITIADGLKTSLGEITFAVIMDKADDILTTTEKSIADAMRLIWERMKIIVEPSAAVPLAAILEGKMDVKGKRVGIILSGGNVDLDRLPFVLDAG